MTKPNLAFLPLLLIFSTGYSMEEQSSQEVFDPFHPTPEMLRELKVYETRMHNVKKNPALAQNFKSPQTTKFQTPPKRSATASNPTNSGGVKKKRITRNSTAFPSYSKKKCPRPGHPHLIDQYLF